LLVPVTYGYALLLVSITERNEETDLFSIILHSVRWRLSDSEMYFPSALKKAISIWNDSSEARCYQIVFFATAVDTGD